MLEPWEYKSNDDREIDSLPTYLIFCEDENSEPDYIKYFETPLIKINLIRGQKSMNDNLTRTIKYCLDNNIMKYIDSELTRINNDIIIWSVYDRDKNHQIESYDNIYPSDIEFNTSIEKAEKYNINTAWSNDAFELWILLHFESIDTENFEVKSRDYYYNQLTNIFKNVENPEGNLSKIRELFDTFSYKKDLKSKKNFSNIVIPHIIKQTKQAITRAKKIDEYFNEKNLPLHMRVPSTQIYKLVEELIVVGKKEI